MNLFVENDTSKNDGRLTCLNFRVDFCNNRVFPRVLESHTKMVNMVSSEEEKRAEERKYCGGILIICLYLKEFFISSYLYIKNTSNKKHTKACA